MGKPKYIYLTDENHERLKKEPNASGLVNELLSEHYKQKELNGLTKDELRKRALKLELERKYQEELKQIEHGN